MILLAKMKIANMIIQVAYLQDHLMLPLVDLSLIANVKNANISIRVELYVVMKS
jgi:hypothetical protein